MEWLGTVLWQLTPPDKELLHLIPSIMDALSERLRELGARLQLSNGDGLLRKKISALEQRVGLLKKLSM